MRLSIRKKIFISMFIVSIIPVSLFTYFATENLYTSLDNQIVSSGENSIEYMHDKTEAMLKGYSGKFYELEADEEFKDDILTWCYDGVDFDYNVQWRLITILNFWMSIDWQINSIEIHNLVNGQVLDAKRTGAQLIDDERGYEVWNTRDKKLQTNTAFMRDNDEMLIMHQMNKFETGNPLVVIVIRSKYSSFENLLEDMRTDEREAVFLFNDEDYLISMISNDEDLHLTEQILEFFDEIKARPNESNVLEKDGTYIFGRSVSKKKLYVIRAVPKDIIRAATNQTLGTGILLGVLGLVVAFAISFLLSIVISKPIVELSDTMKTLVVNDYSKQGDIKREDEIGRLHNSFHYMVERNQELINREYKSTLEMHKAQINALQAQINPHFLYNTLQVIGGMTLKNKTNEIYSMTIALSDIMRYSLSFSSEMVRFRQELKYLESYIHIQNQRFENEIHVEMDIDDKILEYRIPKLILQPIIENSFKHGLESVSGDWHIKINAELKDKKNILIKIIDNGKGISEEKLAELKEVLENSESVWDSKEHIGLKNINERIRLIYGDDYGLNISSFTNEGTTVEILISAVLEEKDNEI